MYQFIQQLKTLSTDVYKVDDVKKLNQDLSKLNQMYDELMSDASITSMEKKYVLSSFIKLDQITMYVVPVIKRMYQTISEKYDKYHCKDGYPVDMLPLE